MNIFQRRESEVRSYIRSFPVVFETARGSHLIDREGRRYLDFFCGAGALNYGHNPAAMKEALIRYLTADGVAHSLDMATTAKQEFLERFETVILDPRGLDYKVQFTGPTGANAVEAALKLARRVTQRGNVIAFTNAYHGLSAGALAVTANSHYRHEAWVQRHNVSFLPFDGYLGADVDTAEYLRKVLADRSSGVDLPAAVLLETVQAEGGVNVASARWLQTVAEICRAHDILLIVDDIQVGCGRAGTFFSFEPAGLKPDLVVLSKSISGFGLPMSLLLIRPELDQWKPGEHTGTFRGNNLAFVSATEALSHWETPVLADAVAESGRQVAAELHGCGRRWPGLGLKVRGTGLIWGLEFADMALCQEVAREAFARGLVIETCGSGRNVLKFLPPLNIAPADLAAGVEIVRAAIAAVVARSAPPLIAAT
jgi:diaminobutyrate-2-oxoglutarate transaminase